MGNIMTLANLESYRTGGNQPGWPITELLYQKVPILAYRNYLCKDDKDWPLCWDEGRIEVALALTVSILKAWQAFRPEGSAPVLKRLIPMLPPIVMKLQAQLRECDISG